ncbi:MAG: membrane protein insertase YidC [Magnetovibrionaceae bacterium]
MLENKNMILAIVISIAIMFGFEAYRQYTAPDPSPEQLAEQQAAQQGDAVTPQPTPGVPAAPGTGGSESAPRPDLPGIAGADGARDALLAKTERVKINTDRLHGSFSLKGMRIDDLTLADYQETLDPSSPEIVLLQPQSPTSGYFAEFGWVGGAGQSISLPGAETQWTADRSVLTPDSPVTLTWDNGEGLTFNKTIAIDDRYMFTITQSVTNTGSETVTVFPYGLVSRTGTPEVSQFFILHEGPLGVFDGTLTEVDYSDLVDDGPQTQTSDTGWIGITDKYWLAALIPTQGQSVTNRFTHRTVGNVDRYQTDFLGLAQELAPGATVTAENLFFAGAKEINILDAYEAEKGIANFDLAIDFGWFYFLTKPIFYALIWINDIVGNYGIAILLLTVAIKAVFFPLANKSYRAMSKMRALQPKMEQMRERFGDDKMRLNQEMMKLYKTEKVNPASGCLPILVQIPVFFALYKVLFVTIEMRHAPFFGWIQDLSAPDPTSIFNLFGLIAWTPPDFLMIGVWPLIMGLSMFLQQKLNPQPTDPIQARIFLFLPFIFTFLLAQFPAGLVIYWAWNNVLSITQQKVIMMRMGVK